MHWGRAMKSVAMSMIISVLGARYGEASAMDVPKDLAGQYAPGGRMQNLCQGHAVRGD